MGQRETARPRRSVPPSRLFCAALKMNNAAILVELPLQGIRFEIQHFRRRHLALRIVAGVLVTVLNFRPLGFRDLPELCREQPQRIPAEVVKQRAGVLKKQRQEKLGPGRDISGADFVVDFLGARVAFKVTPKRLSELLDAVFGHRKFPRRQKRNFFNLAV